MMVCLERRRGHIRKVLAQFHHDPQVFFSHMDVRVNRASGEALVLKAQLKISFTAKVL